MSSESRSPTSSSEALDAFRNLSISNVLETPMDEIRRFFRGMSQSSIFAYGLGIEKAGAPDFAKNAVVVVMDCEKFEHEPRCLTEYGLQTFTRKEMQPTLADPGSQNAHYINRTFCRGYPEKNRFGITRFATKQQAKDFLTSCLSWPIDVTKPDGDKCPIIFLGHAVENEMAMLQQELGVDPTVVSNVVAIIDTQHIAKEKGVHRRGDKIGLEALMRVYKVAFRDGHTAGNDAAYTAIGAIQMVMGFKLPKNPERSLQSVVDDLEPYSQSSVPPPVGVRNFCTRCESFAHKQLQCRGGI
ncbi:hypothetical protein EK21DRAFT_112559 [Setomelanomma holmii]|uniref:Gfd2/YDR514C-like C-terminal domain-containing protein n=1 Tax=Setomelanomma holmii TaxID=210430 RepID=A0A9P4H8Z9_9PLEO|nr:hypothetical protein EK21DRAFT_112559 [Setomelanomma holmii]